MKKYWSSFPAGLTLLLTIWLIGISVGLKVPVDIGDGVTHYFIASSAWSDPLEYLNHWGKPFFTLLSSPFAQFGLTGIVIFNCLVFGGTSLIAIRILKKLDVPVVLQLFFPVLLLLSPDYLSNVMAGLTEPLFGLVLTLSAWFFLRKKWLWMALVVSLLPFCRSEGQWIIVLAATVLLLRGKWKYVPFLGTAFLVYAIIGSFALGDFMWYFHDNPYQGGSIYGHGSWDHFWVERKLYLGTAGYYATVFGFFGLLYVFLVDRVSRIRWTFVLFSLASFFGILLAHAYLWAYGKSGSLGLTRVVTQGLPVFFIVVLYFIRQFGFFRFTYMRVLTLICLVLFGQRLLTKNPYSDQKVEPFDQSVMDAASFVKKNRPSRATVYFFHPLFAYASGLKSGSGEGAYQQKYFYKVTSDLAAMKYGDLVVRDSHFGPKECGLPLDSMSMQKEWVLVREFRPAETGFSYHGEPWSVKIYQKIPPEKQQKIHSHTKTIGSSRQFRIVPEQEFTPVLDTVFGKTERGVLHIRCHPSPGKVVFVCDKNDGKSWSGHPVSDFPAGGLEIGVARGEHVKLYFWNPDKLQQNVTLDTIKLEESGYHPLLR